MGYFNYFIKCIIRNITYKLFKPKVFLVVLLSVIILFCFNHYGFCMSDDELTYYLNSYIQQNNTLNEWVVENNIDINALRTEQKEQLEVIIHNQKSIEQNLEQIKSILSGTSSSYDFIVDYLIYGELNPHPDDINGNVIASFNRRTINCGYRTYDYLFKGNTTYTFTFNKTGVSNGQKCRIFYTFGEIQDNVDFSLYYAGEFTADNLKFDITLKSDSKITFFFANPAALVPAFGNVQVEGLGIGVIEGLQNNIQQGNELQQEQNQLQQEQNQLQQEQNDFLKQEASDDDISVDSFNSVDSNDITSAGLTGVFTNIYNSITSWNSKNIELPIPYTNKNIVIPANYTENMLSSFGGGWIITFISSIYYFIVARFIIYSITSIINSIKSGSILETDSKNNITTDML